VYATPTQQADGLANFRRASNRTHVFWAGYLTKTVDSSLNNDAHGSIVRCPATGCEGNPTVLATIEHVLAPPSSRAFATDDTNLYWIEGQGTSQTAGVIMTMPKNGASHARVIAPAGHLVGGLAVQGSNLCWSESSVSAAIKTCDLSNCAATRTSLTTGETYPHHFAVVGDSAAWLRCPDGTTNQLADGRLVDSPIDSAGRGPTVFPITEGEVSSLAIDATHVYWTTAREHSIEYPDSYIGGSVTRISRPR
jgi:hypothetical protein